jgi:hypothetical protein
MRESISFFPGEIHT